MNQPLNASRPKQMREYDVPTSIEHLLPWDLVEARIVNAKNYWLTTVGKNCQPHSTPVWGVRTNSSLVFSCARTSRKARDLRSNKEMGVYLEDGTEAVIIEGTGEEVEDKDQFNNLKGEYIKKYAMGFPDDSPLWKIRPSIVFAWKEFPKTCTRYDFGF